MTHYRLFKYWALGAVLSFCLISCEDENPCSQPTQNEVLVLSDTAKSYLSNYTTAEKIIFVTASGEEISFKISNFKDTTSTYSFAGTCEEDATLLQSINGLTQVQQLSLSNPSEISGPLFINLHNFPNPPSRILSEMITVTIHELFSPASFEIEGSYLFEHNLNVTSQTSTRADSLTLNGKVFYDVLEVNFTNQPALEIKYTQSEGIIFIKDYTTGKEYVYDRTE